MHCNTYGTLLRGTLGYLLSAHFTGTGQAQEVSPLRKSTLYSLILTTFFSGRRIIARAAIAVLEESVFPGTFLGSEGVLGILCQMKDTVTRWASSFYYLKSTVSWNPCISPLLHWIRQCSKTISFLEMLASTTVPPPSCWEGSRSPRHSLWPQQHCLLLVPVPRKKLWFIWKVTLEVISLNSMYSTFQKGTDLPKIIQLIGVRDGGELDAQNSLHSPSSPEANLSKPWLNSVETLDSRTNVLVLLSSAKICFSTNHSTSEYWPLIIG